MTDAWGRPAEGASAPHREGRIGAPVARMRGPLFADETAQQEPPPGGPVTAPARATSGGDQRRRRAPVSGKRQAPPVAMVALLFGAPLLGAVLTGGGLGWVYAACAGLGAAGAAWLTTPRGLWWVGSAAPAVVLAVAVAARDLTDGGTSTTAGLATHALRWVAGAFPAMAVAAAACVVVVAVRSRKERGRGRA